MINTIIGSDNYFLRQGIKHCLVQAIHGKFKEDVNLLNELNCENISTSNVVVLLLSPGDKLTCMEILKHKRDGLIIFFSENKTNPHPPPPACHTRSLHFSLKDSVAFITSEINKFLTVELKSMLYPPPDCSSCQVRGLTSQQYLILDLLMSGMSIEAISNKLNVSVKAIHYHKYNIMKQYRLRNDYELLKFYQNQSRKRPG